MNRAGQVSRLLARRNLTPTSQIRFDSQSDRSNARRQSQSSGGGGGLLAGVALLGAAGGAAAAYVYMYHPEMLGLAAEPGKSPPANHSLPTLLQQKLLAKEEEKSNATETTSASSEPEEASTQETSALKEDVAWILNEDAGSENTDVLFEGLEKRIIEINSSFIDIWRKLDSGTLKEDTFISLTDDLLLKFKDLIDCGLAVAKNKRKSKTTGDIDESLKEFNTEQYYFARNSILDLDEKIITEYKKLNPESLVMKQQLNFVPRCETLLGLLAVVNLRVLLFNLEAKAHAKINLFHQKIQESTDGSGSAAIEEEKRSLQKQYQSEVHQSQAELEAHQVALAERVKADVTAELTNKNAEEKERLLLEHAQKMANATARLLAIEAALDGRANTENIAFQSHYLWLACETLRKALESTNENELSWSSLDQFEAMLKPLHSPVKAIERVATCHGDSPAPPLVSAVLHSIPTIARSRGVYTEDMLRARFSRVYSACRNVALVDGGRNSIYAHVLSYLRAKLRVYTSAAPAPSGDTRLGEDVDNLTVLDMAAASFNIGDLPTTVRLLNQLTGESSVVARDWLNEARLHLEARQAARVLSLFSTASSGFSHNQPPRKS